MLDALVALLVALIGVLLAYRPVSGSPVPASQVQAWGTTLLVVLLLVGVTCGILMKHIAERQIRYRPGESQMSFSEVVRRRSRYSLVLGFLLGLLLCWLRAYLHSWNGAPGSEMANFLVWQPKFWGLVLWCGGVTMVAFALTASLSSWGGQYTFWKGD